MKDDDPERRKLLPKLLEEYILQTLDAALRMTIYTMVELYPFSDEEMISSGRFTPAHAFSRALLAQIGAMEETLRLYLECLTPPFPPEPDNCADHASVEEIPF